MIITFKADLTSETSVNIKGTVHERKSNFCLHSGTDNKRSGSSLERKRN